MILRRILYIILIGIAFAFYLFDTGYLSWIFLVTLFCIPPLSLCFSLVLALTAKWECFCDREQTHISMGFHITVRMKTLLPLCHTYARIDFENQFDGTFHKQKLHAVPGGHMTLIIPFQPGECGVIRCFLRRPRLLDLSGLFALPMRCPAPVEVLVLPDEIPFDGVIPEPPPKPVYKQEQANRPRLSPTRETSDIRPYREGDSIRDIHWKLTARAGKLMVREFQQNSHGDYILMLLWTGTPAQLGLSIARLQGLLAGFTSQGYPHQAVVAVSSPQGPVLHWLDNHEAFIRFLWQTLSKTPPGDAGLLPEVLFDHSDIRERPVIIAEPQGVYLYDAELRREALT